jgi:hypothetical protein
MTYQARLQPLNHSTASGSLMLTVNGDKATVMESLSGLAATLDGKPYPHLQNIRVSATGACPGTGADTNGDGVISASEGVPSYGPVGATLSTRGATSPNAGMSTAVAPTGARVNYSRTLTLDPATMASVMSGTAVIVVHGVDPSTLSKQAQGEKSELVPSLPLAVTSSALCGPLVASQMTTVPGGPPQTGGGGTAGIEDEPMLLAGGALLLTAAGALGLRRRIAGRD